MTERTAQGWVPVRLDARRPAEPPAAASLRVGMVSLGCPKNRVDSEVMLGQLRRVVTPEINAISSVFLLISIVIVTLFFFLNRKQT